MERKLTILFSKARRSTFCPFGLVITGRYFNIFSPSTSSEALYDTDTPETFAIVVACTFAMIAIVVVVYDVFVQRRNNNLIINAARSNAIVTSLFPSHIRDQLLEHRDKEYSQSSGGTKSSKMRSFLTSTESGGSSHAGAKPLADLFLETTVL